MSARPTSHKLVRRGMAVGVYTAVLIALGAALLTGGSNGAAPTVRLIVERSGAGVVHGALSCPSHAGPCTATVSRGTTLTLTAAAAPGSRFRGWSGTCTGRGVCRVTLDADQTVTATFVRHRPPARHHAKPVIPPPPPPVAPHITRERVLTLTINAAGPGSVDLCDGVRSCSRAYEPGTQVAVTARPYARGAFHRWDGCVAYGATCRVAMTRDRTVTAHFLRTVVLTTSLTGDARLDIRGRDACGGGCTFRRGARAKLRVTHAARAVVKWTGARCDGDTCTVRMTRDRTVKAAISDPPRVRQTWHAPHRSKKPTLSAVPAHTLDVRTSPGGSVQVGGVRCQGVAPCRHEYAHGARLVLVAEPDPGAAFVGWAGCPDATGSACDVVLTSDRAVIAMFG
jgi:hypothetical protein